MKTFRNFINQTTQKWNSLHGQIARKEQARNWRNMAVLAALTAIIISFAQNNTVSEKPEVATPTATPTPQIQIIAPSKSKARYSRVFPYSHKQEFTTTREIKVSPQREGGEATYPVGTKVRILFSYEAKKRPIADRINGGPISPLVAHKILIGETQEQIIVPTEAIAELGGTPGEPLKKRSTQPPAWRSTIREDGPKGFIWTGSPTGDENVPSSDPAGEQVLFQKLNALRKSKGLHALKWNENLARAARYTAGDNYVCGGALAHWINDTVIPLDSNTPKQDASHFPVEPEIVADLRFDPSAKGSNWAGFIRHGASNPTNNIVTEGAFERWVRSPGHYKNMLLPAYNQVGIGNVGHRWIMVLGD